MEEKTQVSKNLVREERVSNDPDVQYVAPDVAAAQAGEKVDFTMDVETAEEDKNDTDA